MFPLLIPLLASGALWALRRRGTSQARLVPPLAGGLTLAGVLLARSGSFDLALWRPTELYGDGLAFRLDALVVPYALMACAIFTADWRDQGVSAAGLLRLAVVLAAISANNLLALVVCWSLLAAWSYFSQPSAAGNTWQLAAVAPLFAAAATSGDPSLQLTTITLLALAAVLLARSSERPYLAALPGFAMLSRLGGGGTGTLLLGAGAVVLATLAGRRWLSAGLVGAALLVAGFQPSLSPAALLAGAVAMAVAGSSRWATDSALRWSAGAVVAALPLWVGVISGQSQLPLLLIPAAGLLAAPILSASRPSTAPQEVEWLDRASGALPLAVVVGILIRTASGFPLTMLAAAAAAFGLALLMASGPRWLYRQPAYLALVQNAWHRLGQLALAILNGFAALVRSINDVLEGEASTVWLFVILLIIMQGLAG